MILETDPDPSVPVDAGGYNGLGFFRCFPAGDEKEKAQNDDCGEDSNLVLSTLPPSRGCQDSFHSIPHKLMR